MYSSFKKENTSQENKILKVCTLFIFYFDLKDIATGWRSFQSRYVPVDVMTFQSLIYYLCYKIINILYLSRNNNTT